MVNKFFKEGNPSSKYRLLHVEKVQLPGGDGVLHLQQETQVHLTIPNTKEIRIYLQEHKYFKTFIFNGGV